MSAVQQLRKRVRTLEKGLDHCGPAGRNLVAPALREARTLAALAPELPGDGNSVRVLHMAEEFARTSPAEINEDQAVVFLKAVPPGFLMAEIWAFKIALGLVLAEGMIHGDRTAGDRLRALYEFDWNEVFEGSSLVHAILCTDPAGVYPAMDFESRDLYRRTIADLASRSEFCESEIADQAISLARKGAGRSGHVGFYLVGKGLPALKRIVGYRPTAGQRLRDLIVTHATGYYLAGIELMTFLIVFLLLEGLDNLTPVFAGFFLLLLPATQAAVDFMNNLTSFLLRPRLLPRLDFSEHIPPECATLVAVPALLFNEDEVDHLCRQLEIRYLANRAENLYFALLTDSPDSDRAIDERDVLSERCASRIDALNTQYGSKDRGPFYLFHRHRIHNPSEGRWMGWERKRGKLLDLNRLLRGGFDSFPLKRGDLSVLPGVRYVIALDADTQLPLEAASQLIGTIAHPLNEAVIDPRTQTVVEGYGILQPRIGVSVQSASRSRLANIYSGETGFDIYTRAVSDAYQDLFGEGIFTGKGIYDVDALRATLEHRFPENALLSHDLIEGAYARAGLVTSIELIDDYPSHFSAYNRRRHRWLRGDWQIARWILSTVPDQSRKPTPNPISLISRWKILDNLRRSLFEPATLLLLLSGWFYLPGSARFWTSVSLAMLLMPAYSGLLFALLRAPRGLLAFRAWADETITAFGREHMIVVLHLSFLVHDALLALDAIVRSMVRVFLTRKKLLEWETAAEAESGLRPKAIIDRYLLWSPWIAAGIGVLLGVFRPEVLRLASPVLLAWVLSPVVAVWLASPPELPARQLPKDEVDRLRVRALRTWRYFLEWSGPENHWLIPDHVRDDGTAANRISPTNLGLLLDARIAAVHFGWLTLPEFARLTRDTLQTLSAMEHVDGHTMNWYDTTDLRPLDPPFVSSVDSGNLAACLWTLKQAALEWASNPPADEPLEPGLFDISRLLASASESECAWWEAERVRREQAIDSWRADGLTPALQAELAQIGGIAGTLAEAIDFRCLFDRRRKVLSVGLNARTGRVESAAYDLLASESRTAAFVGIAKGDLPPKAWFHLGRRLTVTEGERVLVSWTGTIFEYLMPQIWMRSVPGTILQESVQAAIRVQQKYAARAGVPWGISEAACSAPGGNEYGYSAFGVPDLALKPNLPSELVISPYSTFLALPFETPAAVRNLAQLDRPGWSGIYGLFESIEWTAGRTNVIRMSMAHHLGMSLLSICNLLFDSAIQGYFHAEPQVQAAERLLHERVPRGVEVDSPARRPTHPGLLPDFNHPPARDSESSLPAGN